MALYNRNHRKLRLDDMQYLDCGECAKVFFNEEMILKEYYPEILQIYRLSPQMFDVLKDIDNPHFIKLFDIYSELNLSNLFGITRRKSNFIVDAYTAKYYFDARVNILYENKDYILDNFRELNGLFELFTRNNICTDDIKRNNVITGKNDIVIIDPDLFYFNESFSDLISIQNKKNLLHLFRSICIQASATEPNSREISNRVNSCLNDIVINKDTDVSYELYKKLNLVKKPIDLFRK